MWTVTESWRPGEESKGGSEKAGMIQWHPKPKQASQKVFLWKENATGIHAQILESFNYSPATMELHKFSAVSMQKVHSSAECQWQPNRK